MERKCHPLTALFAALLAFVFLVAAPATVAYAATGSAPAVQKTYSAYDALMADYHFADDCNFRCGRYYSVAQNATQRANATYMSAQGNAAQAGRDYQTALNNLANAQSTNQSAAVVAAYQSVVDACYAETQKANEEVQSAYQYLSICQQRESEAQGVAQRASYDFGMTRARLNEYPNFTMTLDWTATSWNGAVQKPGAYITTGVTTDRPTWDYMDISEGLPLAFIETYHTYAAGLEPELEEQWNADVLASCVTNTDDYIPSYSYPDVIYISDTDYSLVYSKTKSKAVGTYSMRAVATTTTAPFKTMTATYKILPKSTSITLLKKAGATSATLKWSRVSKQCDGYIIKYAPSLLKLALNPSMVKVKSYSTVKTTIKKLKPKKTYYFQIRTYKKVGSKTYRSTPSLIMGINMKTGEIFTAFVPDEVAMC